MSNKSSVEWLADRIDEIIELYPSERQLVNDAIKQAKAMHKLEIQKAWYNSGLNSMYSPNDLIKLSKEYYNETFGNDTP